MDFDALLRQTDTGAMKKIPRHPGVEFTSLCVDRDILKEESLRGLLPLSCHTLERGRWSTKRFLLESSFLHIGRRVGRAEILVEGPYVEDVQVVMRVFGGAWRVIESGIYNLLAVNGIRTRQATIERWSPAFLKVGDTPIVITIPSKGPHGQHHEEILPEGVVKPGYRLSCSCGTSVFFEAKRSALIGSNPSCDLRLPELDEFSAIFCPFNGSVYLYPLFNPGEFKVDGEDVIGPRPLKPGSVVSVGAARIQFEGVMLKEPPAKIPDLLDVELRLLEIGSARDCGESLKLPPPGETFIVGRSHDCYMRVNSSNVSREHASVRVNSTNIFVEDSYSRNGTYVNDERIQRRTVRPGETIRFGDKSYLLSFAPSEAGEKNL